MMRIARLFSGGTSRPMSRWSLVALPSLFVAMALFAVSCRQTPVDSNDSATTEVSKTQASFGPEGVPRIEIDAGDQDFVHDPNASPKEMLELGQRYIKKQVAEGKITKEQAKDHWKMLKKHVHQAMGLGPKELKAMRERRMKLADPEIKEILEDHSILVELKDGEEDYYFVKLEDLSKLPPDEAIRVKKALHEIHEETRRENSWEAHFGDDDKLHEATLERKDAPRSDSGK